MNAKTKIPAAVIAQTVADLEALLELLKDGTAVRYEKSRVASRVEDAGISAKGGISRPTEDAALDPVRLSLSEEVDRSARFILKTSTEVAARRFALEKSLERWAGGLE